MIIIGVDDPGLFSSSGKVEDVQDLYGDKKWIPP